jgi:hypothetical protein
MLLCYNQNKQKTTKTLSLKIKMRILNILLFVDVNMKYSITTIGEKTNYKTIQNTLKPLSLCIVSNR